MNRLRYYRDKFEPNRGRPFAGSWAHFALRAADGTRIEGTRLDATAPPGTPELAIVLAHGLFANRRLPSQMELAESLARFGSVWTFDLRGHGSSAGTCTLGDREALDVAAVTSLARAYSAGRPVVTIGVSMGAAATIRSAARFAAADAVVAISAPATWRAPRSWAARRTALAWTVPGAWWLVRAVSGVRLGPATPEGSSPVEVVGGIAPAPVLVVHGTADPFFPAAEAVALCAAAGAPKALWLLDGGGHADALFSPAGMLWRPTGGRGSFSAAERDPPPGTTGAFVDELMARLGDLRRAGGPGGGNPQPPAA